MARKKRKPARKTTRKPKKTPLAKTTRSGGRTIRCKYVAKRGSKTVANALAKELRQDGYRALVSKSPQGVAGGYDVFSCGKRKRR